MNNIEEKENYVSEVENEVDLTNSNVLPLRPRLAPAGKEPPRGPNWLTELDVGTVFLAKEQGPSWNLGLFFILKRLGKAIKLGVSSNGSPTELYVDPIGFSNKYRLYEILGIEESIRLEDQRISDLEKKEQETTTEETKDV